MKTNWKELERSWRKQLLADASGNVLDIGVGEGDNFKYYPGDVQVVATDTSARVIEKAKAEATKNGVKTEFIVCATGELQLQLQSFDTIVSAFSLSAYEQPLMALQQFSQWCKPDGKILLLEYGLSKYEIVKWLQEKWAGYHYRKTGNHIGRDLLAMIGESGMKVKRIEVRYAGMVYLVWASLKNGW